VNTNNGVPGGYFKLITQRSQVQILPPQPRTPKASAAKCRGFSFERFVWAFSVPLTPAASDWTDP